MSTSNDKLSSRVKKGAWTQEEDVLLRNCIEKYGEGKWHQVPVRAGLNRCRKSCRLRWLNYLRPHIKRGDFDFDEVDLLLRLHKLLGNRWSLIAGRLPGRTANDVKNYWNTHLRKKLIASHEKLEQQQERKHKKDVKNNTIIRPRPRTFSRTIISTTCVKCNNTNSTLHNKDELEGSQKEVVITFSDQNCIDMVAGPMSSSSSASSSSLTSSSSNPLNHAHHFISIKLTAKNYLFWKTQLVPFLRGQNLHGFIDGSKPCPAPLTSVEGSKDSKPNPDYTSWIQQDQLIMSLLISSLSEETLPIVIGLNTSKEIWEVLEAALSSPSNTRILNLHMQLQNLKQDDMNVTQFLQKAKLLSDELAAAGRPLSTSDFNTFVFKGLRSDFKDIVTTLSARPEPVAYAELLSLLLNHEFMHGPSFNSTNSPVDTSSTPAANFVQRSPSSDRPNNQYSQHGRGGRGSFQGRGGRGGRGSFSRNSNNTGSSNYSYGQAYNFTNDGRSRCQICNGTHHLAPTCFQRYNHTVSPSAHLTHQAPIPFTQNWFPDTGATHHVAPDLSSFHHVEEYKGPNQLYVGNGQGLSIHNTGLQDSASLRSE